jgi:hypothetical protein
VLYCRLCYCFFITITITINIINTITVTLLNRYLSIIHTAQPSEDIRTRAASPEPSQAADAAGSSSVVRLIARTSIELQLGYREGIESAWVSWLVGGERG